MFCDERSFLVPLCTICFLVGAATATASTLANMQSAFNSESNAHVRYLAFAQRADNEGYGEIASLFRAIARAEEIHAENYAEVIRELGGSPRLYLETLTINSTRENLEVAIHKESFERATIYREFVKEAGANANDRVLKSLNYAKNSETDHARLFRVARRNLDSLRLPTRTTFYVCSTCGFIARETNFPRCPFCFTKREAFELVW